MPVPQSRRRLPGERAAWRESARRTARAPRSQPVPHSPAVEFVRRAVAALPRSTAALAPYWPLALRGRVTELKQPDRRVQGAFRRFDLRFDLKRAVLRSEAVAILVPLPEPLPVPAPALGLVLGFGLALALVRERERERERERAQARIPVPGPGPPLASRRVPPVLPRVQASAGFPARLAPAMKGSVPVSAPAAAAGSDR